MIESTVPTIKVGSQLADRDSLMIPAGAQVRVVLPSGKTQTVKGPFTGTVAELAKGQPRNEGVLAWLSDILKTGGATEITPGATRSIGRVAPRPMGFSWSAVPMTIDGGTRRQIRGPGGGVAARLPLRLTALRACGDAFR